MDENSKKYQHERHLVAILIMIIALLVAALVSVLIIKSGDKPKSEPKEANTSTENTDNKVEPKKEEETKEEEVSIDKYSYLLDRLYMYKNKSNAEYGVKKHYLKNYLDYDKMTVNDKIAIVLSNLEEEKIDFKSDDKCKSADGKIEKCENMSDITMGYSGKRVEKTVKEIFGKNSKVEHSFIKPYEYDVTADAYFMSYGIGLGSSPSFEKITKITVKGNNIYVYVIAGSTDFYSKVCFDIDVDNSKCEKLENSDDSEIDYANYMNNNKDKFAKYKYTFEKEDNNYIIKKLEKID